MFFYNNQPKRVLPKYYSHAIKSHPKSYYDYLNFEYSFGNQDDYDIETELGSGKYSIVYKGFNIKTEKPVVIKILKPIENKRINREVNILNNVKGGPNIVSLLDIVRDTEYNTTSLIFEYIETIPTRKLIKYFTEFDIRFYVYQVLEALDYTNSKGIFHRDIKLTNIIIDYSKRKLRLIDWGLAEYYFPYKENNVKVSTKSYKAPELLLNHRYYNYNIDVWSLGTIIASIVRILH